MTQVHHFVCDWCEMKEHDGPAEWTLRHEDSPVVYRVCAECVPRVLRWAIVTRNHQNEVVIGETEDGH